MLREFHIRNLALIDEASIELGPGLNVFTGATGVGKSLVLGALTLLLGGRASADSVRTGQDRASVSCCFEIDSAALLGQIADLTGADVADGQLAISREVDSAGRSRCRVNGVPVTVSMLKEIGAWLVDIHGQHDHESLRVAGHQLDMLDRFGRVMDAREDFGKARGQAVELRKRRDRIRGSLDSMREEAEYLKFQIGEIDAAKLKPGEDVALENEQRVLASAERLQQATAAAHVNLYEAEESLCSRLKQISRELASVAEIDGRLNDVAAACEQALVQLEDAAFMLLRYVEDFTYDPQRLHEIDERLELIRRLEPKYGPTVEDILAKRDTLAERLAELVTDADGLDAVEADLMRRLDELKEKAEAITKARRTAARTLAKGVRRELKDLGVAAGKFDVDIQTAQTVGEELLDASTSAGMDKIEFQISTNPGEAPRPLRRTASGGEISRTMLAIKKCLAEVDRVSVFVFDEIDANIGGRLGSVVGQKLFEVSKSHQIVCVTHLPQIASFADRQLKVEKQVDAGRTTTTVAALDEEGRCDELAEMIRGSERTALTRAQAEEMLLAARTTKAATQNAPTRPKR